MGDGVFEVLSTSGDTHLGGDDFDKRIVDFLADDFQKNEGVDLRQDRQALQRLTEAAEKAKARLLSRHAVDVGTVFMCACCRVPVALCARGQPGGDNSAELSRLPGRKLERFCYAVSRSSSEAVQPAWAHI